MYQWHFSELVVLNWVKTLLSRLGKQLSVGTNVGDEACLSGKMWDMLQKQLNISQIIYSHSVWLILLSKHIQHRFINLDKRTLMTAKMMGQNVRHSFNCGTLDLAWKCCARGQKVGRLVTSLLVLALIKSKSFQVEHVKSHLTSMCY